ncbi:FAD/NAD(P)-binding protein [Nocardioides sp.]|uniref:FAD/NAD(P)-binding protein n=1 Tax=Nocardioides sp. TaxID=35761 RepID=UPI0025EAA0B6|nr:FAD/NAD(P)-binding protein [Nocardioides sp.]
MSGERPRVVVVGAGAGGTLTALHLVRAARSSARPIDVVLLDPADQWGRGAAFGTTDDAHLLNVPASGMSALPDDPDSFVRWLAARSGDGSVDPHAFVPRRLFARYLDEILTCQHTAAGDLVGLAHVRTLATGIARTGRGWRVAMRDGRPLDADAMVLALGLPRPSVDWAPGGLAGFARFVADPWEPGALDRVRRDTAGPGDVLVVGTGLTMVDVALTLTGPGARPDRRVRAISRHGRLPREHRTEQRPAMVPDVSGWGADLDEILDRAAAHLRAARRATGDWRPGVDGLRFRVGELWGRLDDAARLRFVAEHAGEWGSLRHRIPAPSAQRLATLRAAGRLDVGRGQLVDARPLVGGGLAVTLSDGTTSEVGWVVNCTGPAGDVRVLGNPLVDDLLRPRPGGALASVATAGLGLRTAGGRLVDDAGSAEAPAWAVGALRRGELWESTAVPEIRAQAESVARAVVTELSGAVALA